MSTRLEELNNRVEELERESNERGKLGLPPRVDEATLTRVKLCLKGARENRDLRLRAAERASKAMGVVPTTMPIEELHQRMIASGIRPEDNGASRGIVEMREE